MAIPFLIFAPMIGACMAFVLGRKNETVRDYFAMIVTGLVFVVACFLPTAQNQMIQIPYICGLGIAFSSGSLQTILVIVSSLIWFFTTIFSREYFETEHNRNRYYFFMLLTEGATLAVFLSADFFTTFIFFEIMSFASYVWVLHEENEEALDAAKTYLTVAIIGGLVTLMGLFLLYQKTQTLYFHELYQIIGQSEYKSTYYVIGLLIFTGFGAKAGIFPLHIWLPKAHPVAPSPASALLSCLLVKTGIFGAMALTANIFLYDYTWGCIMLGLGVITMVVGAVLALFSVNLKRTLACSSMSQLGFIMVGIGMQGILGEHNALAAAGSILHVVNHSLLKLVLFVSAGVVFMNLEELNLNKIKGFGRDKPILKFAFFSGVCGLGGIPFGNAYISKTLLHESIVEYIHILEYAGQSTKIMQCVEYLFLFTGGLTLAYMTKIFVALFIEKNDNLVYHRKHRPYIKKINAVVLVIGASILWIFGIVPHHTQDVIAEIGRTFLHAHAPAHTVAYLAWVNVKGAVISCIIAAVIYFGVVRTWLMGKNEQGETVYIDRWWSWLDLEQRIYKPLLIVVLPYMGGFVARLAGTLTDGIISLLRMGIFNSDKAKIISKEDKYFSVYTQEEEKEQTVYREGFARSLLMIGIGLSVAMLYILF